MENTLLNENTIWKVIDGFDNYEISNTGLVRNNKSGRILSDFAQKTGYHSVVLSKEGKQYTKYVHRLVAEAFIDNPENKAEINHLNFRKNDNRVDNLKWVTRAENMQYNSQNWEELKKQQILMLVVKKLLVEELNFNKNEIENILK